MSEETKELLVYRQPSEYQQHKVYQQVSKETQDSIYTYLETNLGSTPSDTPIITEVHEATVRQVRDAGVELEIPYLYIDDFITRYLDTKWSKDLRRLYKKEQ